MNTIDIKTGAQEKIIKDCTEEIPKLIEELRVFQENFRTMNPSFFQVIFTKGDYGRSILMLRDVENRYAQIESSGIEMIFLLNNDFLKSKTMGNILCTLGNSLPYMISLGASMNMLNSLIQKANFDVASVQSKAQAYLSLFMGALGLLISLIPFIHP